MIKKILILLLVLIIIITGVGCREKQLKIIGSDELEVGTSIVLTHNFDKSEQEIWNSSDTNIAEVYDGMVIANNVGAVTITLIVNESIATKEIQVIPSKIQIAILGENNVLVGESITLNAQLPNGIEEEIVWKSEDETIAKVNQNGLVKGIKPGKVIIQTYNIDHYAINYAANNNYLGFYQEEMKNRLAGCYPPYFYLTYIIVKSKDYVLLSGESNKIANVLRTKLSSSTILGSSVCIPFKINDIMRFGILIKYKKEDNLYDVLRELIDHYKTNNKIKIEISFNPNNI